MTTPKLPELPEFPEPFAVLRLTNQGTPADISQCEQDAEMWAYGIETVFTADQMLALRAATLEYAAQIVADMPITYERDGHYINTRPEDYEAAIRSAAKGLK